MNRRTIMAMLLAFAMPGAGHLSLGKRGRGLAFFAIVTLLFLIGLAVDGGLYTLDASGGEVLRQLASYASMGSGLLYFLGKWRGATGQVISATFEYGTMFTLTAGLMNLLLVLDCYDIAARGKP
jgi:hypothetical protein